MKHTLLKLKGTIAICVNLFCARTFGTYCHSGWDGDVEYARYKWRGREWKIPTSYCEKETVQ